jgi:hypothetical protein
MAGQSDLKSIPGLKPRHRKVLGDRLGITTVQALAAADSAEVRRALAEVQQPPNVEDVQRWQETARRHAAEADNGAEWDQTAVFVVSFERREMGGCVERRLVVAPGEKGPEAQGKSWGGWECAEICDWMHNQLPAETPPAGRLPLGPGAVGLRIEEATLLDDEARADMLPREDDAIVSSSVAPQLEVVVAGAEGAEVVVVARYARAGRTGRNLQEPTSVDRRGRVALDLSGLPEGAVWTTVYAWPERGGEPAVARLRPIMRSTPAEP